MAKNYVKRGHLVTCTAGAGGVVSGTLQIVGTMFGVATTSAAENEEYELQLGEVWKLPKVAAQAWAQGATVYWDAGADLATTVDTGNTKIGVAEAAAANPSGEGRVRLNDNF